KDIRELIQVDDVMEDDSLRFGPNGGLIFCMEYFANTFDWLEESLGHVEDDYILFDYPGQIELYTHLPVMKQLVEQLQQWEFRVCGFISGVMAALSAMVTLEISQVNIMTKMDLLSPKAKKEIEKYLDPDIMVRFLPFDRTDEEGINIVLQHIDFSIQYGEDLEFKEPKEIDGEPSNTNFDEFFQDRDDS
uniref:GPN-loop GTPase 3 n=1 Tax=Sinocyclocheilus grahami TaxID=75366 RepID=A0A672NET6_SINGR